MKDATYIVLLALLAPFGLHRLRLLWLRMRRPVRQEASTWTGDLPRVTVQLPVRNEANVVERLIDAACQLDYPAELLDIQVLDDSDDQTSVLARRRTELWQRRGFAVWHVQRKVATGYKAGALADGMSAARGELILVLDADFVPPPTLLRDLIPAFSDPQVGAVQAAWAHFEPERSWLTRAQALFLDAHFAIEHEARYRAGMFFNFNGSAGMWRRTCIEDAGGWQGDTLTEDIDLSYRAQLKGWRFVFKDDVRVSAELPGTLRAVEIQQSRWTQGGIQCARKLLPSVWRAPVRLPVKIEATAHLLGHCVHPLTLLMGLALALAGWLPGESHLPTAVHAAALAFATVPFILFYGAGGMLRGNSSEGAPEYSDHGLPRRILESMVLGLGLGVPLTFAVARGFFRRGGHFARTPKSGVRSVVSYEARLANGPTLMRLGLGIALVGAATNVVLRGGPAALPFTALFAIAYVLASRESLRTASAPGIPSQ